MIGRDGGVRALVLALRGPADWETLSPLWRGVQADLAWPAPAIAVNGCDAFELWVSLAQPVPLGEAVAVGGGLCRRYLAGVKPQRLSIWPDLGESGDLGASGAAAELPAPRLGRVPALHPDTGRWSAFVAPDLPAVFGDDPSLDFPPSEDAQAELLSRLVSVTAPAWQDAVLALQPLSTAGVAQGVAPTAPDAGQRSCAGPGLCTDPQRFLLDVMNDSSVALALRIEAAKALLPYTGAER